MDRRRIGRWLLSGVAGVTAVSPLVADWNRTHVFNPAWPPHAKFHGGHTIALGLLLGTLALWMLWRRPGDERERARDAALVAGVFWAAQALAALTPGAAVLEHSVREALPRPAALLLNPVTLDVLMLALVLVGYRLAAKAGGSHRDHAV